MERTARNEHEHQTTDEFERFVYGRAGSCWFFPAAGISRALWRAPGSSSSFAGSNWWCAISGFRYPQLDGEGRSYRRNLQPTCGPRNFLHFAVVAIILLKALLGGFKPIEIIVGAAVYSLFGVWFGLVLFTHPLRGPQDPA
jgi:hypothetical protein